MPRKITPIPSFEFIIFGGTGDLAQRKLLPALYQRYRAGYFQASMRILGLGRSLENDESYRKFVAKTLENYVPAAEFEADIVAEFLHHCYGLKFDISLAEDWQNLARKLVCSSEQVRAFYLAVAPEYFGMIGQNIGTYQLIKEQTRIILEKPIGHDYSSAVKLNDSLGQVFAEEQIFRIDHYLGKEAVQNLMVLRFANMLFEPLWNAKYIHHVEILAAEQVGLEKRAAYYDHAGALRDMVQNHMLQLLCLTAMEPPGSKEANSVHDEKVKILKALRPINVKNSTNLTVRGQYERGHIHGKRVGSYHEDLGSKDSYTETYVALKVEIDNWRWAGIPFYLRTGKRLAQRISEIVVTFRAVPHNIFTIDDKKILPNRLVIRLQPEEGVKQWLMMKEPGPGVLSVKALPLDMRFVNNFEGRNPEAYERLLTDAIRGDHTLFMRRDEVECAWQWIDPILEAWQKNQQNPFPYQAGSWGPKEADSLIERDGCSWWKGTLS